MLTSPDHAASHDGAPVLSYDSQNRHTSGPSVCLSADGSLALSGRYDGTVRLWDVAGERLLRTFNGHRGDVNAVALSSTDRFAASGGDDQVVRVWEVATGRVVRAFAGHADR